MTIIHIFVKIAYYYKNNIHPISLSLLLKKGNRNENVPITNHKRLLAYLFIFISHTMCNFISFIVPAENLQP